jgi:hypothetical protein
LPGLRQRLDEACSIPSNCVPAAARRPSRPSRESTPPSVTRALLVQPVRVAIARQASPDPAAWLATVRRIWLVVGGRRADALTSRPDLAAALTGRFRRVAWWTAKGITVALYGP